MKRLIASLAAALFALNVAAATLVPVQLLNPAGSSSGQAVVSTGSSSAPAWGSVSLVAPGPIGSTTPSTGAFTTLSASGLFTPTAGIVGVTNASTPTAGNVGEVLSLVPASTACPTTATTANLGTLSLSAGDWLVTGSVLYTAGAATTLSNMVGGLNTTSVTLPGAADYGQIQAGGAAATSTDVVMPVARFNVSTTTTVFAVGQVTYSGTCNYAVRIRAWRMR